jgi:hypothetical protein
MMQDVHVTLHPELLWKERHSKKVLFTSKLDFNLREKQVQCYIWSIALCGAVIWTLQRADTKHLDTFEMWCWRMIEKIISTDRVKDKEVLHTVKEERNILHTVNRKKAI